MEDKLATRQLRMVVTAVQKAGDFLMKHYGKLLKVNLKDNKDFVTNADIGAEKIILRILSKSGYSIYSEEAGKSKKKSDYMWIVDPLDGTTNFKIMMPYFNVSIGLAKGNDIIMGVVYYPVAGELFYAVKGKGAYMNKKRIKVKDLTDIKKGVFGYCHGSNRRGHIKLATSLYSKFKLKNQHVRQFGAAALELCYVAIGRLNGFFMNNMNAYDVGAGSIIVKEAGGVVTDFKGKEFNLKSKHILAAPKNMHKEIMKIV